MKYIKFQLTPGQAAPNDSFATGAVIPNTDWIVWVAEDSIDFPINDPASGRPLLFEEMSEEEITAFEEVKNNPPSLNNDMLIK